jgi:hypothetical protein
VQKKNSGAKDPKDGVGCQLDTHPLRRNRSTITMPIAVIPATAVKPGDLVSAGEFAGIVVRTGTVVITEEGDGVLYG